MPDQTFVWVKVQLPEALHEDLKAAIAREKRPDGRRKTMQDKVLELIELGQKVNSKKVS